MDIAKAILNRDKIEGISLTDYKELLESPNGRTSKYRIKLDTGTNGLLVQNLKTSSQCIIKCSKNYYMKHDLSLSNCTSCEEYMKHILRDGETMRKSCAECHRKSLSLYINKQMTINI